MTREIWKSIPGWPTHRISSLGRLKRLAVPDSRGYRQKERISKCKNREAFLLYGKKKLKISVGALVLNAFIGPAPEGKPFACHYDDDHRNNKLGNLHWGDYQDNVKDALRNGKYKKDATTRARMSIARKGKRHSEATKKKISEKAKSPERRAIHLATHLGKKRSEETRRRLSQAQKGKHRSREHLEKLWAGRRAHKNTPEHNAKIAETMRARHARARNALL